MTTAVSSLDQLEDHIGTELGLSGWADVTQGSIDSFAQLTGDHQWIHTDPERARATPFGGTIAHGCYTLALAPRMLAELIDLSALGVAMNYGFERVRFPAPLRVGSRVRGRVSVARVERHGEGALVALDVVFEAEDSTKPVCVAQCLVRTFPEAP